MTVEDFVPVIHDFHQIIANSRGLGLQSPVIEDQAVEFGQSLFIHL
jgi:hypothetical protein